MKKSISILAFLAIGINNDLYTSEIPIGFTKDVKPIIISDTLTQIEPLLIIPQWSVDQDKEFYLYFIKGFYTDAPANTVINYWKQSFDPFTTRFIVRFCPTIMRYNVGGTFENLGSLNSKRHHEAKEACRLGKALYIPYKQGAIIYNLLHKIKDRDIIYQDTTKKITEICSIIDDNLLKPYSQEKIIT